MKDRFHRLFGNGKPVIGVVHVLEQENSARALRLAQADARALLLGGKGVDALLIENAGEKSNSSLASEKGKKILETVCKAMRKETAVPLGVNVLPNDFRAALGLCKGSGLDFIQLHVFADSATSLPTHPNLEKRVRVRAVAHGAAGLRKKLGLKTCFLTNVLAKYYSFGSLSLEQAARHAASGGSDAIVVSGTASGKETPLCHILAARETAGLPTVIGSGLNAKNLSLLGQADAAIVGTAFRRAGIIQNPVDSRRVQRFMRLLQKGGKKAC